MNSNTKFVDLELIAGRADVLLRLVPVALAGGGPVTQTFQVDEWLDLLGAKHKIPVRRIGVAGHSAAFVDEAITGVRFPLDRSIHPGSAISDIYHNACVAVGDELQYLYADGIRHFAAVCCGYTAYGPYSLKQAVEYINTANPDDPITGNVIVQDSCFPDVDRLSTEFDENGYPVTRFHGPAFRSTEHLRIVFTLNGAVPFDVTLSARGPAGCAHVMSTFPFTPRYITQWRQAGAITVQEARDELIAMLPQWSCAFPDAWLVPLVSSGGYFEATNVGRWMTKEHFETMIDGTIVLAKALRIVADETKRSVVMPIIREGAEIVLAQSLEGVRSIDQEGQPSRAELIVLPYDTLRQSAFSKLVLSSDLVIQRTVQTNSFAETILTRRPQVVMTIPAAGYMDAEIMAQQMSVGLLHYGQEPIEIAAELMRLLQEKDYSDRLVANLDQMFSQMLSDPQVDFGSIVAQVAGLSI